MGYESKIIVTQSYGDVYNGTDMDNTRNCYEGVMAVINVGKVGYSGWIKLFETKAKFGLFLYSGDRRTYKDKHGDNMTFTKDIKKVIKWIESEKKKDPDLWYMLDVLLSTLKGFNKHPVKKVLKIVHYGY